MKLNEFLNISAGGPGSGRRPGFGEGRHPGGRPFGMKNGMHKVLTDAGYKYKGAYSPTRPGTPFNTANIYQHPDTGHEIRVSTGNMVWKHSNDKGFAVHDKEGLAVGKGPSTLRQHLATMRAAEEKKKPVAKKATKAKTTQAPMLTPGEKYPIAGYDPDSNEFMHMDDNGNGARTPATHFDNPRGNPGQTLKYVGPNRTQAG